MRLDSGRFFVALPRLSLAAGRKLICSGAEFQASSSFRPFFFLSLLSRFIGDTSYPSALPAPPLSRLDVRSSLFLLPDPDLDIFFGFFLSGARVF